MVSLALNAEGEKWRDLEQQVQLVSTLQLCSVILIVCLGEASVCCHRHMAVMHVMLMCEQDEKLE